MPNKLNENMSKTGAILIKTVNVEFDMFNQILNRLLAIGWSTNKNGRLFYMVDNSFDWQTSSLDDFPLVMNYLEKSIQDSLPVCIDLVYTKTRNPIGFNYLDSNTIMFSISENIKMLNDNWVIDFSWYIERVSAVFEEMDTFTIECLYG